MLRIIRLWGLVLVWLMCLSSAAMAGAVEQPYQELASNLPSLKKVGPHQVLVTEFFSWACPHCYQEQGAIQEWLSHAPKNVVFQRVPVGFGNPTWVSLAKAYYVLDALGKAEEAMPLIFKAIHEDGRSLYTESELAAFCTQFGIPESTFSEYFDSFSIDQKLRQSDSLAMRYGVVGVPTFVVGQKYLTDAELAGNQSALIPVLDLLVQKSS